MVAYLQPSYVGNDAKELTDELVTLTKEVNNSGNGALGTSQPGEGKWNCNSSRNTTG